MFLKTVEVPLRRSVVAVDRISLVGIEAKIRELRLEADRIRRQCGGRTGEKATVQWAEFGFRPVVDKSTGYIVTMAAVFLPSGSRGDGEPKLVFGTSACSPQDSPFFDRSNGANRALGRARKQAVRVVTGAPLESTLCGTEDSVVRVQHVEEDTAAQFSRMAAGFVHRVAKAARNTALAIDLRKKFRLTRFTIDEAIKLVAVDGY